MFLNTVAAFLIGCAIGGLGIYLVFKNNKKKVMKWLMMNPDLATKEIKESVSKLIDRAF